MPLTKVSSGMIADQPAFSAYQSVAQTLASSTLTKITFTTEEFDTNSCYDTSTSRFTPTVAGYYQINGNLTVSTGTTDYVELYGLFVSGQDSSADAKYTYFQGRLVRAA